MEAEADEVERSRRLILEAIGRPADLALIADARTPADALALAGARALLHGRAYTELAPAELPAARGDLALLMRADGPHDVLARMLGVAALRFARVIVLPAPFVAHDDDLLRVIERSDALVFATDPASRALIAPLSDARLAHDCAFYADYAALAGAGGAGSGGGALDLFGPPPASEDSPVGERELEAWLGSIRAHDVVRTDDARMMIASALLGVRVEYADDADGRLAWIASRQLGGRPLTPIAPAEPATGGRPAPAELDARALETLRAMESAARGAPPARVGDGGRVTAVILTRDRPRHLRRALDSLERSGRPVPALVIDQNSSVAAARAIGAECDARAQVRLHRSAVNLGCAGGRSVGAQLADTEFLLFLDDDAELMPGALDHLLAALDADPGAVAVAATVVAPGGLVVHSGGWRRATGEVATFGLIASGLRFAPGVLPPSGAADWVPGTALLVRRALLEQFPLDEGMAAYYEDNEWCERVARARTRPFLRSREALAIHHLTPKRPDGPSFAARSLAVELLAAQARFYERHGLLLGPWLFHLVPELTAADHSRDLAGARLLMELITARGTDWFLAAWMNGELRGLIDAHRREVDLRTARAELGEARRQLDAVWIVLHGAHRELDEAELEHTRLAREIAERDDTIRWLHDRHETLVEIEQGGWWRLRTRLLPLLRLADRWRARP